MSNPCEVAERVSLIQGGIYRFAGIGAGVGKPLLKEGKNLWVFPPSLYRLLEVSRNHRTGQDQVVYVGVGKDHDQGRVHEACLLEWHEQFTLLQKQQPTDRGDAGGGMKPVETGAEHPPTYNPFAWPRDDFGDRGA